jgi:ribosomal protein S18 acetylase RimI-like enzyme
MITYGFADALDGPALTRLWNAGFEGYFVTLAFDEPALAEHIARHDVSLADSIVALDDGAPIGFALLGVRARRAWVGGMGVAPAYRRRGLGGDIMARLLAHVAEREMDVVTLEVLEQNWARRLYEAHGFQVTRVLLALGGTIELDADASATEVVSVADALAVADRVRASGPAPAWQREPATITAAARVTPDVVARAVRLDGGAVITAPRPDGGTRLLEAVAIDDDAARALLGPVAGRTITIGVEPEDTPFCRALLAAGARVWNRQYEMRRAMRQMGDTPGHDRAR